MSTEKYKKLLTYLSKIQETSRRVDKKNHQEEINESLNKISKLIEEESIFINEIDSSNKSMNDYENTKSSKKESLIQDLSVILMNKSLSKPIKDNIINYTIYNWTEMNGKHEGNEYWSVKAYDCWAHNKENRAFKLVHEHIVPRYVIKKEIYDTGKYDYESLEKFFIEKVKAVVITKDENKLFNKKYNGVNLNSNMPNAYYEESEGKKEKIYKNIWARYKIVNKYNNNAIKIYKFKKWGKSKEEDQKCLINI